MRSLLLLPVGILLLLASLARPAAAEEVFVLDNGEVLRGWVVREDEEVVHVRLSGFMGEARVQFPAKRIVRRFLSVEKSSDRPTTPKPDDWARTAKHVAAVPDVVPHERNLLHQIPAEEPSLRDEGFFRRMARVIVLSVPRDLPGRSILGLLLFGALLSLVALGGRVAEIDTMGAARAVALALLLGGFLALDVYLYKEVLRADRAIWIVPLQGLAWLTAAWTLTRCGGARAVLLFAFVLFSLAVVLFVSGAILVSF
jgi:cbb3-type cytochrome oxidase subunit 3